MSSRRLKVTLTADMQDFQAKLVELQRANAEWYRTPMWERVLLWVVLAALVLVVVSGVVSVVTR